MPPWEAYALTLGIVVLVVLVACRIAPAHIRRGCEASPHLFEWQTAPKGVAEKPPDGKRGPTGNPAELV